MKQFVTTIAIISAVLSIVLIIMQRKGVGLGSAFGGEGFVYKSRRGAEKIIFYATIFSVVVFVVSTFLIAEIL